MRIHICTENPCPLQDKEYAEMLNNSFTTCYTGKEKNPILDEKALAAAKNIKNIQPIIGQKIK